MNFQLGLISFELFTVVYTLFRVDKYLARGLLLFGVSEVNMLHVCAGRQNSSSVFKFHIFLHFMVENILSYMKTLMAMLLIAVLYYMT